MFNISDIHNNNITTTNTATSMNDSDIISLSLVKWIVLIIISAVSFVLPQLPSKYVDLEMNCKVTNALASGILLEIALTYLLPQSLHMFQLILNEDLKCIRLTCFIVVIGYSLVFIIEKVLLINHNVHESTEQNNKNDNEGSEMDLILNLNASMNPSDSQFLSNYNNNILHSFKEDDNMNYVNNDINTKYNNEDSKFRAQYVSNKQQQLSKMFAEPTTPINRKLSEETLLDHPCYENNSIIEMKYVVNNHYEDSITNSHKLIHNCNSSYIQTHITCNMYINIIAFNVHLIIEGVAIGMQRSTNETLFVFIAIIIHKIIECISIRINIINNLNIQNMNKKELIKILILLSISTPLGILIGMLILQYNYLYIEGILFATSAGSFIYISISEIVIDDPLTSWHKKEKFISFSAGALLIFILQNIIL